MAPDSKCSICGMIFVNSDELTNHRRAVHVGTMLQCQSCNKFFEDKHEFEEHAVKIHGDRSQAASNPAGSLRSDKKSMKPNQYFSADLWTKKRLEKEHAGRTGNPLYHPDRAEPILCWSAYILTRFGIFSAF